MLPIIWIITKYNGLKQGHNIAEIITNK